MRQIENLRQTSDQFDKVLEAAAKRAGAFLPASGLESGFAEGPDMGPAFDAIREGRFEGFASPQDAALNSGLEAIILAELRPAWFIRDDKIVVGQTFDHMGVFSPRKEKMEALATRAGRVDLLNHATMSFVGTGWLIAEDIVVTNRHVAQVFARPDWPTGWTFGDGAFGEPLRVENNTLRQDQTPRNLRPPIQVTEILYVAGPREPDIAFLRVIPQAGVDPIPLDVTRQRPETVVAAVGYPASDGGRNDPVLMGEIFGQTYNVKRFSPGLLTGHAQGDALILTDYTSLGGNSGSVVLGMESEAAVGLHFAGVFRETNYAVAAPYVAAALRALDTIVPGARLDGEPDAAESVAPSALADREGYQPYFLGEDALSVPLPGLGNWTHDIAPVEGASDGVLRYTHYSVVQSASRRLPLITAVNIDGEKAFRLKRKGSWRTDGRIRPEHQVDNVLYKHNPLDRGHMVRRKDPGWGDNKAEAQLGELDTFFYTNCAPQHAGLNQKDWLGLEDYILGSATTRGFKACVLTGPVFQPCDRTLKVQPGAEDIAIPESYWKVAVMVNDETGALSATGYLLTQGDLIQDLTEAAFILGAYETYQVQIAKLAQLTGLDFGPLEAADPLATANESLFGEAVRPLATNEPIL